MTTIILVVEDEDPIRELVGGLLKGEGYDVLEARHGAHALELAHQQAPALVLTDLMMPVMDGRVLCRQLKTDVETRAIPIVVMTASGRVAAETCGADAYVTKPFELDQILDLVTRYAGPPARMGS